ncbi:hypothetical protein Q5424_14645 [Conexibacter sp. JD483]|uniref:DUF6973 domain-containing protein n=1 Tax=unclassified Conexibacter TaxID=2627773 RepID=UPI002718A698|nr:MULTISPECIES: hypothetical protein [unclassified Conexibacter]MDO8187588.1 hypothetical protein [Conexibacter sp. CPCC 205706]MDO8198954.1 hypothetical protein [Conexibacter sp. CPCC 205762]MDR9370339.1 hypothetical protein [Conexibacter sp. JD483]
MSSVPLHFRDGSGAWRRIDNRLVEQPDGTLENGAGTVDVEVPATAAGAVAFAADDRVLSFRLVDGDSGSQVEAEAERATFEDAVEQVDLSYDVVGSQLKETLTLDSAGAASTYLFEVSSPGLRPRVKPSGAVAFEDGQGRQQLGFTAPWMKDARGVVSRAAHYEIVREGERSQIALRLDADWLRSPQRAYPVIVDPSVYVEPDHYCEIQSGSRSNTTYCDDDVEELWIGRDAGNIVHRNLLALDDLAAAVPDYVQVVDSSLALYLDGQTPVGPSDVDVHHLTRGFGPGATWNRLDGRTLWGRAGGDYAPEREARKSTSTADPDGRIGFDMTELAERIVSGDEPSPNLLVKAADETRRHVDVFDWAEVRVQWDDWTGMSDRFTFRDYPLSDGSTLRFNVGNWNIALLANDVDLEADDGRFTVGRYFNSLNGDESVGTFGRGTRGDFGSISLQRNERDGSYLFRGPGADDGVFHKRNDGSFAPPRHVEAALVENLDGTKTVTFYDSTEIWTFDASGRLVQTRQDYGYTIDGTYGANGIATLRDSLGSSATFSYDRAGDMRQITDELSAVRRYDYDGQHRLVTYTSATGATTRYAYDSNGRLQRISLPDRTALRIAYYGGGLSPYSLTPIDASGVDQPATGFSGGLDWSTVQPPGQPRTTYWSDLYDVTVDLIQTGSAAALNPVGEIPALDGRFTRGDAPLSVDVSAAQEPDGIQLLELEVDDVEVDSTGAGGCDETTCPRRASATLVYDPTFDPEGSYEFAVNSVDGDDERTDSPTWAVGIDRTAPTVSADRFESLYSADSERLDVYWEGAVDPQLADGSPSGGIVSYRTRYQRDGGAWSEWTIGNESGLHLDTSYGGEVVTVEIEAIDAAGNVGPTATTTATAAERDDKLLLILWDEDDPETYRFTPALPAGQALRVVDGGRRVLVVDGADRQVRELATVHASDDDEQPVGMSYSLDGATVVVEVDHRVAGVRYPVVVNTRFDDDLRTDLNRMRELFTQHRAAGGGAGRSIISDAIDWLTDPQLLWCVRHGKAICELFEKDADRATDMAMHLFRGRRVDNTRSNAFKHSYWTALMTQTSGHYGGIPLRGYEFSAKHEEIPIKSRGDYWRGQMDLHNNRFGYNWVINYEENSPVPRYPTDREICRAIFAAAKTAQFSLFGPFLSGRLVFRDATRANSWINVAEPCKNALSTSA